MKRLLYATGLASSLTLGTLVGAQLDTGERFSVRDLTAEDVYGHAAEGHLDTMHVYRSPDVDGGPGEWANFEAVFKAAPMASDPRIPVLPSTVAGSTSEVLRPAYVEMAATVVADYCAGLDGGCPDGVSTDRLRIRLACDGVGPDGGPAPCIGAELTGLGSSTVSHTYVPTPAEAERLRAPVRAALLPRWCAEGGLCPGDAGAP